MCIFKIKFICPHSSERKTKTKMQMPVILTKCISHQLFFLECAEWIEEKNTCAWWILCNTLFLVWIVHSLAMMECFTQNKSCLLFTFSHINSLAIHMNAVLFRYVHENHENVRRFSIDFHFTQLIGHTSLRINSSTAGRWPTEICQIEGNHWIYHWSTKCFSFTHFSLFFLNLNRKYLNKEINFRHFFFCYFSFFSLFKIRY